jgi:hypothetical protein
MSTRDPFLNHILVGLGRLAVWVLLSLGCPTVLWFLVWMRCFDFSAYDTLWLLVRFVTGKADTVSATIGWLIVCLAIETPTVALLWLFASWRRKGELSAEHIRGSRLKD